MLMMVAMMVTILFIDDVDNDSENDDMTRLIFMMTLSMIYIADEDVVNDNNEDDGGDVHVHDNVR